MQLDLSDELHDACNENKETKDYQQSDKDKKVPIVVPTNTSAKPKAVMIEVQYTVVA